MRILNNKSLIKRIAFYSLLAVCLYFFFLYGIYNSSSTMKVNVNFTVNNNQVPKDNIQVYYKQKSDKEYAEKKSVRADYSNGVNSSVLLIPNLSDMDIRIDIGNNSNEVINISSIKVSYLFYSKTWKASEIASDFDFLDMKQTSIYNGTISYVTTGGDPQLYMKNSLNNTINYNLVYGTSAVLSIIATILLYKFFRFGALIYMAKSLKNNRNVIISLGINDFKTKYAGSYFGITWAFVQPIMTILVFWFVFQVGFRSTPVSNIPFVLWLISGLIPWFFFSDALNGGTNAFIEYSYLVKKVVFNINILPIVKIFSALIVHVIFILFMIIVFALYGFYPNVYMLQIIYYSFCIFCYVTAFSLLTSSIIVFFKDLSQIIAIGLQFGMWLTPIMWQINMIPDKYTWIFKLNPMYYVIAGYRNSILYHTWFFSNIKQMIYFWSVVFLFYALSAFFYKRLKPHFADVL